MNDEIEQIRDKLKALNIKISNEKQKEETDWYNPDNLLIRFYAYLVENKSPDFDNFYMNVLESNSQKLKKLKSREQIEIDNEIVPTNPIHLDIYQQIVKDLASCLKIEEKIYNKFLEIYYDVCIYWTYRDYYSTNFSWSIPSLEALLLISQECFDIIEIYSGTGYWASLLNKLGCQIKCLDNYSWKEYSDNQTFGKHYIVNNIENYSLTSFENCNLMISWPPYGDEYCTEYLKKINPNKLIYIGEVEGGCCGSDSFFQEIDKNYKEIKSLKLYRWSGINDWLIIYEKII